MNILTQSIDGVDALDSMIDGCWQFAITSSAEVLRRPASYVGTYGGWRWECLVKHCIRFPSIYPAIASKYAPTCV